MKKLLTILAATGLTATTGTTVVACIAPPPSDKGKEKSQPEIKEISEILGYKVYLGEFKSETFALNAAEDVIGNADLKNKVNLAKPKDGRIHVTVRKGITDLKGETDFIYTIELKNIEIDTLAKRVLLKDTLFIKINNINDLTNLQVDDSKAEGSLKSEIVEDGIKIEGLKVRSIFFDSYIVVSADNAKPVSIEVRCYSKAKDIITSERMAIIKVEWPNNFTSFRILNVPQLDNIEVREGGSEKDHKSEKVDFNKETGEVKVWLSEKAIRQTQAPILITADNGVIDFNYIMHVMIL